MLSATGKPTETFFLHVIYKNIANVSLEELNMLVELNSKTE